MSVIPLTPRDGAGQSIAQSALEAADIIVSTTTQFVSRGIRLGTGASVSHAMLYTGDNYVIEAIGSGVVRRPLSEALHDSYLAVAYRHQNMNPIHARLIIRYANEQLSKPYDTPGAILGGGGRASPILCVVLLGTAACGAARAGTFSSNDRFFCSELVIEAYRQANMPIITGRSDTSNPNNIVEAYSVGRLQYVGHLKA